MVKYEHGIFKHSLNEKCNICPDEETEQSSASVGCYVAWPDVAWIIKWTLKNAKHLDIDDTYLIEKETDKCHLELMQRK